MRRLHPDTLQDAPAEIARPAYQRASLRPGIVHLGLGAFHRAHQAVYTDEAMNHSGGDWGIIGVSLRSAAVSRQLNPQDGLYSVRSRGAETDQLRVIGAVQSVLVAPESPAQVAAAIARPDIAIVTLTITEKGYLLAADGASLNRNDPALQADVRNSLQPATAIGLLALGLRERMVAGGAALTIMSCDNLGNNSKRLRAVLMDYVQMVFPEVLPWLEDRVRFPCSMVDRIVPAMTDAARTAQSRQLGLRDDGAVATEVFSQWIMEDDFAGARPDWVAAGAQLVNDIAPYEAIKLRLLNASHSAIAYCGLLAGLETVDAVMADRQLRSYVERLMQRDLMPVLEVPADFDIEHYQRQLLVRFANPSLGHRCAQIAMDGSEKISQRWLPTLQVARGDAILVALSAWCGFVLDTDLPLEDPCCEVLVGARNSGAALPERLAAVLACARISPSTIADFGNLLARLERNYRVLQNGGIRDLLCT